MCLILGLLGVVIAFACLAVVRARWNKGEHRKGSWER